MITRSWTVAGLELAASGPGCANAAEFPIRDRLSTFLTSQDDGILHPYARLRLRAAVLGAQAAERLGLMPAGLVPVGRPVQRVAPSVISGLERLDDRGYS